MNHRWDDPCFVRVHRRVSGDGSVISVMICSAAVAPAGSMQTHNSPNFFVAIAIELTQSTSSVSGAIAPFAVRFQIQIQIHLFGHIADP